MKTQWPVLSYEKGKSTYETLQLWTQIVGKIKLATLPWVNHSWHITLHITPTGLTTQNMPYKELNFQIDFDFVSHELKMNTSSGTSRKFSLYGLSVSAFYKKIFDDLKSLGIDLEIKSIPVEIVDPIDFKLDTVHHTYEEKEVIAFHRALLSIQNVFMQFRSEFKGKCSPIHFFWGSFDMALSFFSGRKAPKHPGGVPGLPDWVAEEAYCREVSSSGFWPGSGALPEAAFYCYLYPEPQGYKDGEVKPSGAYYHPELREFVLPYAIVQRAENPEGQLLDFLRSTYGIGSGLAKWSEDLWKGTQ
ncbi:hypothetical protein DBR11_01050 [Pedobacter sp. HMWF019]|uniref:DUF5996 family protein n=1 Tax=Pedobacter sp. HMWF019 TaxID=2056856 RepID=UPI000D397350|nr:DUF5996 family protein [Pedobacter sp. HMWF019]PTT03871.1 hypothetical protein DBR11_01050 [Pedobacter sp. HMWF019]